MIQARCFQTLQPAVVALVALPLALAGAGCGSSADQLMPGGSPAPPAAAGIDFNGVLQKIQFQAYQKNPEFTRVSNIYQSDKDTILNIAEWVSTDSATQYLKIAPDVPFGAGPNEFLPVGTVIVRSVYDPAKTPAGSTDFSAVTKITFMVKGPPTYLTGFGDWAFGVTDPDGNVLKDPNNNNAPEIGYVFASCHQGCHEQQRGQTNDWLFGVKTAARLNAPSPSP